MLALVDRLCAVVVVAVGAAVLLPLALTLRLRRPVTRGGRRIAYLGTGRIAQVFPRNGVNLFLERECSDFQGYFEQLWNVHFPAGAGGALSLTPRHHLIDVDFPLAGRLSTALPRTAIVLRELLFLGWLLPFLRRNAISIVTATNPFLQGMNAALAGRLLGLPYAIIITRDFDWDWRVLGKRAFASVFPSRAVEARIGRWVLRGASLVLADREYYRAFAVRNGARPDCTIATRVLADRAYAEARACPDEVRQRYRLGPGPLLTYVGRLDADKFAIELIDCLALVRERFPSAQLACAGSGSLAEAMQQRAAERGLAKALHLLGSLDLDDLASLVASSDVVVAPHMGYTLVEAGLTGVPIVTYTYDFHAEVLVDGADEWLAPFRDVQSLADRVCHVLSDPATARSIGDRLRARLRREHSLDAVVPLYRQAYDRVLAR
jgi:glycosyltransferase involved in cell wall biosynthesis